MAALLLGIAARYNTIVIMQGETVTLNTSSAMLAFVFDFSYKSPFTFKVGPNVLKTGRAHSFVINTSEVRVTAVESTKLEYWEIEDSLCNSFVMLSADYSIDVKDGEGEAGLCILSKASDYSYTTSSTAIQVNTSRPLFIATTASQQIDSLYYHPANGIFDVPLCGIFNMPVFSATGDIQDNVAQFSLSSVSCVSTASRVLIGGGWGLLGVVVLVLALVALQCFKVINLACCFCLYQNEKHPDESMPV